MDRLPLDEVRVADFSWQIAGPACTRYLGAMGAEVIRIESNRPPDPYRDRSISHFINQSKKSVTLNLAHLRGVQLAKQVIGLSDVVIENFAPGSSSAWAWGMRSCAESARRLSCSPPPDWATPVRIWIRWLTAP